MHADIYIIPRCECRAVQGGGGGGARLLTNEASPCSVAASDRAVVITAPSTHQNYYFYPHKLQGAAEHQTLRIPTFLQTPSEVIFCVFILTIFITEILDSENN